MREQLTTVRKAEEVKQRKQTGTRSGSNTDVKVKIKAQQECGTGVCAVAWKPQQSRH